VAHAQIEETLADLNEALPGVELTREQVRHVFSGILPGVRRGSDTLLKRPRIIDHGKRDGAPGAWTVIGVKFTEAPFVAARVWEALVGRHPRALPPRPPAVAVPSIVDARAMSDRELTIALTHLARAEWQASAEDLLWRRTDLWMDEAPGRAAPSPAMRPPTL
jgi:glycerol-3-phosphate dehydrogenase